MYQYIMVHSSLRRRSALHRAAIPISAPTTAIALWRIRFAGPHKMIIKPLLNAVCADDYRQKTAIYTTGINSHLSARTGVIYIALTKCDNTPIYPQRPCSAVQRQSGTTATEALSICSKKQNPASCIENAGSDFSALQIYSITSCSFFRRDSSAIISL
jgi:hypothetical protein